MASSLPIEIVGDDLLLLEHVPPWRAAWTGEVHAGRAKAHRERTVVYAAASVGREALTPVLARLPEGVQVEPLTWKARASVVVALGEDMDQGPPLEPTPGATFGGERIVPVRFHGRRLRIDTSGDGLGDFPVESWATVVLVDPGVEHTSFNASLRFVDEERLADALSGASSGRDFLLVPPGRRSHLAAATRGDPGQPAIVARTSPSGVTPTLSVAGVAVVPVGSGWSLPPGALGPGLCEAQPLWLDVSMPSGGRVMRAGYDVYRALCHNQTGEIRDGHRLEVAWSADGRVAALLVTQPAPMGLWDGAAYALPVVKPAVEIVSRVGVSPTDPIPARLRDAGYVVSSLGQAKAPRTAPEVFFAPGFESEAADVASRIGATGVQPLSWRGRGDLVIALP